MKLWTAFQWNYMKLYYIHTGSKKKHSTIRLGVVRSSGQNARMPLLRCCLVLRSAKAWTHLGRKDGKTCVTGVMCRVCTKFWSYTMICVFEKCNSIYFICWIVMTLSDSIFGGNFSFSGQRQICKEGRALWIRAFRAASWIALNHCRFGCLWTIGRP